MNLNLNLNLCHIYVYNCIDSDLVSYICNLLYLFLFIYYVVPSCSAIWGTTQNNRTVIIQKSYFPNWSYWNSYPGLPYTAPMVQIIGRPRSSTVEIVIFNVTYFSTKDNLTRIENKMFFISIRKYIWCKNIQMWKQNLNLLQSKIRAQKSGDKKKNKTGLWRHT